MKIKNANLAVSISIVLAYFTFCRASGQGLIPIRDLWKEVVVNDSRKYDDLLSSARKISKEKIGSADELTAELLIGKIEMNRALNEAEGSLDKARSIFENLAKKNEKSWQGQAAKLSLINLLHVEGKHSEVITEATKGLKEMDWAILGEKSPADLKDYKVLTKADAEFTPDVLRMLIARSYFDLGKKDEAKQWALKIENAAMKKETEESIQNN